jgi:uncharacterized protein (DUF885 family)
VTDSSRPPASDGGSALDALADRFWAGYLDLNPSIALYVGDERYDDRFGDPTAHGQARSHAFYERTTSELDAMPVDGDGPHGDLTRDLLRTFCDRGREEIENGFYHLRSVSPAWGPQVELRDTIAAHAIDTPIRLERFLARLVAYPAFLEAHVAVMRQAIAMRLTAPPSIVDRTIAQLERLLAEAPESSSIVVGAGAASDATRASLVDAVRRWVQPAEASYLDVLRTEYRPAARGALGIWCLPNGEAMYRQRILATVGLPLDPEQVHAEGLEHVGAIEMEREAIVAATGARSIASYEAALAADPTNSPASEAELIGRATDDVARAMAAAPAFFGRLPANPCEVRLVDEYRRQDAAIASYLPGPPDGSRSGTYYVNPVELASVRFSRLADVTYHEAVPGHHFQLSLGAEQAGLNALLAQGSWLVCGAFVEGWGLYAERLADEMGLYRNPAERFGMANAQLLRAARLVADTGIHARGWTREQSIAYLAASGVTEGEAAIETDRYSNDPGQALMYRMGQRELERLRRDREVEQGASFDIRAFHDAVLGRGSLPLDALATVGARPAAPR